MNSSIFAALHTRTTEMPRRLILIFLVASISNGTFSKSVDYPQFAEPWSDEEEILKDLPCDCVSVFKCGLAWKQESAEEYVENPCNNEKEVCCERKNYSEGSGNGQKDRVVIPFSSETPEIDEEGNDGDNDEANSNEGKEDTSSQEEGGKTPCDDKKENTTSEESGEDGDKEESNEKEEKKPTAEPWEPNHEEGNATIGHSEEEPNCVCITPLECGATWRSDDEDYEEDDNICLNPKHVCCYNFGTKKEEVKPLQCGEAHSFSNEPQSKEVTSDASKFGEFPWSVSFFNNNGHRFCTGTLVHDFAVITAAHCLLKEDKDNITVRAGDWDILNESLEPLPHQDRLIYSTVSHPNFEKDFPPYDIAIVILNKPFQPSNNINKICLPYAITDLDTSKCMEAGWGKYPGGELQTVQVKIPVHLISRRDCRSHLRNTQLGKYFQLDKSFACARNEDGKELCEGNGGGPLTCPTKGSGAMTLVGVSSWGVGCGKKNPTMYTDILYVKDWLVEVLRQNNAL